MGKLKTRHHIVVPIHVWEIIARLPLESVAREAKVLVEGYQSLIQEDRDWQEPKWSHPFARAKNFFLDVPAARSGVQKN